MSAGFWKRNEKVLMTLLLLILAPTFAASGVMFWWFTDGKQQMVGVYEIHGETISVKDLMIARENIEKQQRATLMRMYGPWHRVPGAGEGMAKEILKVEMLADELGVRIGPTQQQELLREAALDVLTWYRVARDRNWDLSDYQGAQEAFSAMRYAEPPPPFNPDEYRVALSSGKLGESMTVQKFEEAVIASARTSAIQSLVSQMAVAPQVEVYNEYATRNEKRSLDFVQVSSARFDEQAAVLVDDPYMRAVYDENPTRYRRDAAVKLSVAKAVRENFVDPNYEPSLEEIEARYETDKTTKYRQYHPPGWEKPEDYDPEIHDFKPLVDVLPAVEKSLKDSRAADLEAEMFAAALNRADELRAEGATFVLADLFGDDVAGQVVFEDVDWFTRMESYSIDQRFRSPTEMALIFNDPNPDRAGEISTQPLANNSGSFIYRIEGIEGPGQKTFEEAIAEVKAEAERKKAMELTEEYLTGAVTKIRDGEMTFEEWAVSENYSVYSSEEPLGRFSGGSLKMDGNPVPFGNQVVNQLFTDTTEPGDITDPIVPSGGVNLYLAKLTEIAPPAMDQWIVQSPGLEMMVQRNRQQAINDQFNTKLEAAANVTPLFEVEQPANQEG